MTKKELAILAKIVEISSRKATVIEAGYVDRCRTILEQEGLSIPRMAEDLNGHRFLATPNDQWMVSRYTEDDDD